MPSNKDKDRLYVALYVRGGRPKMETLEDTSHWALIVGPKKETNSSQGSRLHAKEGSKPDGTIGWIFEEKKIALFATQMLLVRICVGKIEKNDTVMAILRSVPIRDKIAGWNCAYWVKEALNMLQQDGNAMGTSDLDWTNVRNTAMEYVQKKKDAHRFDGQGSFDMKKAATYDLTTRAETIP